MKKIILVFISLILMSSCTKKDEIVKPLYPYQVTYNEVDMSSYDGVNAYYHCFKEVYASELINTIERKSSGIFILGSPMCWCCQETMKYLSEQALIDDVTIYYIDAYNEHDDIVHNTTLQDKLFEILDPVLGYNQNDEKDFLTPQLFVIVNGEFYGSQICYDNIDYDYENPTLTQIDNIKNNYHELFNPFLN